MSREKLTRKRATCRAHEWKMKSHASLEVFASVSWERPSCKVLAKLCIWKNVMFALPSFYTHYIYPHYSQKILGVIFREKTLENTLES